MTPPKTRKEMEHNLALLFEDSLRKLRNNNVNSKQNVLVFLAQNLEKIKSTPNSRINLLTINEAIRLQSNMLEWISYE